MTGPAFALQSVGKRYGAVTALTALASRACRASVWRWSAITAPARPR